uniref:Uncharacterized protein n=1 Tax=Rhizophora mucronata TaxID=61149 RepID=A0A2P2NSH6_RHIMU
MDKVKVRLLCARWSLVLAVRLSRRTTNTLQTLNVP